MPHSGQQATTNHPPLLGRAVSAHLQQRKPLSTFPRPFLGVCVCFFFFFFLFLSFKQGIKQEGILRQTAVSSLLHRVPELLPAECYLWAEAMQAIHISSEGHSQGGIKWAAPPSARFCVAHGGHRLVWGAALKYALGKGE